MTIENLVSQLQDRREQFLKSEITAYPRRWNIASDIRECVRSMVYARTNWQDRKLHETYLQARFDEGKEQERRVIRELIDMGFEIIEGQKAWEEPKWQLSGKIDGTIKLNGDKYIFEIKSLNPNGYQRINSIEDMKRVPWMKKWLAQINLYLLGNNKEQGLFILSDCLGHRKYLIVSLDYEYAESIVKKLEEVNRHIEARTLPDRIDNQHEHEDCPYSHICLPDMVIGEGMDIIEDVELEADLERLAELKPLVKEHDEIDKAVKERFKGRDKVVAGGWMIGKKYIEKKGFTVPESKYWQTKIVRLDRVKL